MQEHSPACSRVAVILLSAFLCWLPALGEGLETAPGFSLQNIEKLEANAVTLSSLEGKVVLLNVFTTTCDICRAEFPNLIAVNNQYSKREDVQVVGIAIDPMVETVESLVRVAGINYTVLMGKLETLVTWKVKAFPTSFLIDKGGQISQQYVGLHDKSVFVSDIEAIIREK
jgi:peroxiredoxin